MLRGFFHLLILVINKLVCYFGVKINFSVERISGGSSSADYFYHLASVKLEVTETTRFVNIAIPYMEREESIFAGSRMILALGASLLGANVRVRFVITDEIWTSKSRVTAKINFYKYFPECERFDIDVVSIAEIESRHLKVSKDDLFVATAWWTVYVWQQVFENQNLRLNKLFYLIQDFEPGFYPWGSDYALSLNTYKRDIIPIYSTAYLKEYFQGESKVRPANETYSVYLPEINKSVFYPNTIKFYNSKRIKKVFCYCRKSIPRNMFQILVQSLKIAVYGGLFENEEWSFNSAGEDHEDIEIGCGHILKSRGKMSYIEYGDFLRTCDMGISLMYSPHPSYPPLEMAQSGLITITSGFSGKDLSTLSENIISSESGIENIAESIEKGLQKVNHYEDRIRNASLPFPDNYKECFSKPTQLISEYYNAN